MLGARGEKTRRAPWGCGGYNYEYCTRVAVLNTKCPDVYELGMLELASSQPLNWRLVLLFLGKVMLFDPVHLRKDAHRVGWEEGAPALTARSPSHPSFAFEYPRRLEGKNWPWTMELLEVVALVLHSLIWLRMQQILKMERFPDLFAVKSVLNECEMVYIFICPTWCEYSYMSLPR